MASSLLQTVLAMLRCDWSSLDTPTLSLCEARNKLVTVLIKDLISQIHCKEIIQKGNTKDIDAMPFIGGMVMSLLMLQHGMILNDPAMIPVNGAGSLNFTYFAIYYLYSHERDSLHGKLAKAVALTAILINYAQLENEKNVEFRFGIIVTVLMLTLIGAPLLQL
ncbi:uncharacterized protein LOC120349268, partial [Nilaparvata lugens]|uniref:uncharacterized protein LOC120349268 n=1 Tax=Nilaparvata lugens TaxID=108931 RepID=UPI00193D877C